nr:PKD domain-containing protein [Carboxylicivirga marina]
MQGTGGLYTHNTVNGVVAGDGINITANNATVTENRFLNIQAGTGIIVNGADNLVANNFVEAEGVGIAKGICLQEKGSGSQIVFNSINITGTDVVNGVGLEVLGGSNYTVKNNIFANNGGGLAAKLGVSIAGSDWDYNDFYSSGDEFGEYLGTLYSDLESWGSTINADANSKVLNPFFLSETDLRPSQRSINGAGIAAADIALDIDGELRNQAAPDVGADEYLVDFGITQLVSPTLHCGLSTSDSVTVLLKQFGDIPFVDLQIAYQVNGGPVVKGTVPGQISNDIQYTFDTKENLAGHGSYEFKIWLIGTHDDNINNDTLRVTRFSSDVPEVNFNFSADCAGSEIPFAGSASVSSGAITAYEWMFDDGDTTYVQNPTHIYETSGIYNVTLRAYSDVGCYGDTTKQVNLLSTPHASFSFEDACYGEAVTFTNNSSIESGTMTYNWDFGDGMVSDSENPSHKYTDAGMFEVELTATAPSGCSHTAIDTVMMNSQIFANLFTSIDTAWAKPAGGIEPYLYHWQNGSKDAMATGLSNGYHSVTITDASGCSIIDSIEINIPELKLAVSGTDASCSSCTDGTATVTVTQGVAPYYYQWSNGATTASVDNLTKGWHYITVRDAYLNAKKDSVYIDGVDNLVLSLQATDISCFGGSNGAIDLAITGGMAPYTILWSNAATSEDLTDLAAGIYSVTVTDANALSETTEVTLVEAELLAVTASVQQTTCADGNDGALTLSVTGGTEPYDYSWSNGAATKDINALTEGDYTVMITDANGCSVEETYTVTTSSTLSVVMDNYDVNCAGQCDGVAMASASGGAAPYTYSWSNGATGTFQFNLCQDTYTVTVTDANGCNAESTFTINEPEAMAISLTPTDVTCGAAADGGISTEISGGIEPYAYSWDHGETSKDAANLSGGFYYLTVTDANGCVENEIAQVEEPDAIVVTSLLNEPTCTGNNNGSIDLTVSGGTGPYTYNWSNGETTEDISALTAGNYSLTVVDAMSCSQTLDVELADPQALLVSVTTINPGCSDANNGSASANVTGGRAPYTYSWSNGATEASIDELAEGTYSVTVTDALLCSVTETVEIVSPEPLALSLTATQPTCESLSNGALVPVLSGGVQPYTYSWSNGASSADISDLIAGSYTLTVTDAGGCSATVSSELNYLTTISGSINLSAITCADMCNGYAIAQGTGGDGTYSYSWSDGGSAPFRNNLCAGEYSVTITDGQGCAVELAETLTEPEALLVSGVATDATCKGEANGSIVLEVSGGKEAYAYEWNTGSAEKDLSGVAAGYYRVNVTDANGCSSLADFTLTEPSSLISVESSINDVSCAGDANGSIVLSVSGGSGDYTYLWSNGATNKDLVNVGGGSYDVAITDINGCTISESYVVTEPSSLISVESSINDVSCAGESNGSIVLSVSGGSGDYTYLWSTGASSKDLVDVSGGSYDVAITDINGCTISESYAVNEPSGAIATLGTIKDVTCAGESNGSIVLSVSGGSGDYSYLWSNGETSKDLVNVSGGSYDVVITDVNGCTATESYVVNEPLSAITISGISSNASCNGNASGAISINIEGGVAPYTYDWSNGSVEQNLTALSAGTYDVVVRDVNGCSGSWLTTVEEEGKASLSGTASYSKGTVDADDADVVLLDVTDHPYREVASVRMQGNGYFNFTNIEEGVYIVYVKLDDHAKQKYPGVMHSYYNMTHKWQEAEFITLACSESRSIELDMFEIPAADKVGNGKAKGQITYDNGSLKSTQPPVVGAVVMLIDEVSGLPVDYVTTDANGYYEISNIANGNYSIYVDVAGLTLVSTHELLITELAFNYEHVDFEVDAIVDMDIVKIETVPTDLEQADLYASTRVYPNPAANYVFIESALFGDKEVSVVLLSQSGSIVREYQAGELEKEGDKIRIDLPDLGSAFYMIRTEVAGEVMHHKVMMRK